MKLPVIGKAYGIAEVEGSKEAGDKKVRLIGVMESNFCLKRNLDYILAHKAGGQNCGGAPSCNLGGIQQNKLHWLLLSLK